MTLQLTPVGEFRDLVGGNLTLSEDSVIFFFGKEGVHGVNKFFWGVGGGGWGRF